MHIYEELNRTHLQHFSELIGISIFIIISTGTATSRKNTKWQIDIDRDRYRYRTISEIVGILPPSQFKSWQKRLYEVQVSNSNMNF